MVREGKYCKIRVQHTQYSDGSNAPTDCRVCQNTKICITTIPITIKKTLHKGAIYKIKLSLKTQLKTFVVDQVQNFDRSGNISKLHYLC